MMFLIIYITLCISFTSVSTTGYDVIDGSSTITPVSVTVESLTTTGTEPIVAMPTTMTMPTPPTFSSACFVTANDKIKKYDSILSSEEWRKICFTNETNRVVSLSEYNSLSNHTCSGFTGIRCYVTYEDYPKYCLCTTETDARRCYSLPPNIVGTSPSGSEVMGLVCINNRTMDFNLLSGDYTLSSNSQCIIGNNDDDKGCFNDYRCKEGDSFLFPSFGSVHCNDNTQVVLDRCLSNGVRERTCLGLTNVTTLTVAKPLSMEWIPSSEREYRMVKHFFFKIKDGINIRIRAPSDDPLTTNQSCYRLSRGIPKTTLTVPYTLYITTNEVNRRFPIEMNYVKDYYNAASISDNNVNLYTTECHSRKFSSGTIDVTPNHLMIYNIVLTTTYLSFFGRAGIVPYTLRK